MLLERVITELLGLDRELDRELDLVTVLAYLLIVR